MVALICGWIGAEFGGEDELARFANALVANPDLQTDFVFHTAGQGAVSLAGVHVAPRGFTGAPPEILGCHGAVTAVADARIHNAEALRADLSPAARDSAARGDAALIAALYSEAGEAGLDRLRGEFAFALHEAGSNRLICRRDQMGVRPLYSYETPNGLAFASLARAFTGSGIVAGRRDWAGSMQFLARNTNPDGRTMIEGVSRMPPASQFTFASGQLKKRRYWALREPDPVGHPPDFETWCVGLKDRFDEAVARRLPPSGPVASEISAGLDAGGISATAARLLPGEDQHLHAHVYAMAQDSDPELFIDESDLAGEIARQSNRMSLTKIRHEGRDPGEVRQIEPDRTEGRYVHLEDDVCASASATGAEVVLCGWGGDECVTNKLRDTPAQMLKRGEIAQLAEDLRATYSREGLGSAARRTASIATELAVPAAWRDRLADWRMGRGFFRTQAITMPGLKSRHFARARWRDVSGSAAARMIAGLERMASCGRTDSLAATSARHGVQYSFPMLDIDLIEYMLTCPPGYLADADLKRKPFRQAMKGVLPDSVRMRGQKMMPIPEVIPDVARNKQQYLDRLDTLERDQRLHAYVDFARLRKMLEKLPDYDETIAYFREQRARGVQARPDTLDGVPFRTIYALEQLQSWLADEE
ncbi:asparagine synthase-related protein [Citromicrobium bathyomarinum]|uniref:asparagine synthase-related protein n=1 Tax=Sphingomonadales TaxID=204457 RepID=UPI001A4AC5D5|nr:hypothetical protein [Citromicrobium sp.]|tara:strand:+ start:886 stop:2829 length:1944 start_codon:yes stop_codon:yes gene_type:complete